MITKDSLLKAFEGLKECILKKKIHGTAYNNEYILLALNDYLDGLLELDIEIINQARFELEDLLEIDNESIIYFLIVKLNHLIHRAIDEIDVYDGMIGFNKADESYARSVLGEIEKTLKDFSTSGKNISLLDYEEIKLGVLEIDKQKALDVFVQMINDMNHLSENGQNELVTSSLQLSFSLKLLKELELFELGFFMGGLIADKLNFLNDYQLARDFSENFIHLSLKEGKHLELAHFVHATTAVRQKNNFRSLLHLTATIHGLLRHKRAERNIFRRLLTDTQKTFRNLKIVPFEDSLFKRIAKEGILDGWDSHESFHIHFLLKLSIGDKTLINEMYEFLNLKREEILKDGMHSAPGWYNTLIQVQRVFGEKSTEEFNLFIKLFGSILDPKIKERIDSQHTSDNATLIQAILQEVKGIKKTRYRKDLKSDIERVNYLGARAVSLSAKTNDRSLFLLGVTLVSDYSLTNESLGELSKYYEVRHVDPIESADVSKEQEEISNIDGIFANQKHDLLAIGHSDSDLYYGQISQKGHLIDRMERTISFYNKFLDTNRETLVYEDERKVGSVRIPIDKEEREQNLKDFRNLIPPLKINNARDPLLIVKDIDLSKFPHNFLVDNSSCFISESRPVSNIFSPRLFAEREWNREKTFNFQTAEVWVPIVDGDFGLNKLFSDLETTIQSKFTKRYEGIVPETALCGDINVVIAHGASDIASTSFFHTGTHSITDPGKVIGKGKVAILFVCHSGSEKESYFEKTVDSLIRKLILDGYEAVIAPFWALNIEVPAIWLPIFIDAVLAKKTFLESFYEASVEVRKINPHPGAWACLHYYGNPNLKIS